MAVEFTISTFYEVTVMTMLSEKFADFFHRNSPKLGLTYEDIHVISHVKICDRVDHFSMQEYLLYLKNSDRPCKVTLYAIHRDDYGELITCVLCVSRADKCF